MGLWGLWTALALASPFSASDPALQAATEAAWTEAVACVGWAAPTADAVPVVLGDPGPDRAGRAIFEEDVLQRVILRPDLADPEKAALRDRVLAHELAHAWFAGPPALAEGGAQVLTRCVLGRLPGRSDPGPPGPLPEGTAVDLHTWANDDHDGSNPVGYRAAHALAEQLVQVIPLGELPLATTSWGGLLAELARRGPEGRALSDAVRTDPLSALDGAWKRAAPEPVDPDAFQPAEEPIR